MRPTYWLDATIHEVEYEAKLHNSNLLGCSPAELQGLPRDFGPASLIDHDASPEMDLTNVVGG